MRLRQFHGQPHSALVSSVIASTTSSYTIATIHENSPPFFKNFLLIVAEKNEFFNPGLRQEQKFGDCGNVYDADISDRRTVL